MSRSIRRSAGRDHFVPARTSGRLDRFGYEILEYASLRGLVRRQAFERRSTEAAPRRQLSELDLGRQLGAGPMRVPDRFAEPLGRELARINREGTFVSLEFLQLGPQSGERLVAEPSTYGSDEPQLVVVV